MELTDTQLAYLAALIDGEGSLECQKQMQKRGATPRYSLRLSFVMATTEPLATIALWLGLKVRTYRSVDPKRQDRNRLDIPKGMAVILLPQLMPYLLLKRDQATLILEIEAAREQYSPGRKHFGSSKLARMPQEGVDQMERGYLRLRSLKSNKRPVACR